MPAPISERIIPTHIANDNSIRVYERRTISDRVSFQFTRAPHCDDRPEANLWYGQWVDTTEEQYAKEQKSLQASRARTACKLSQAEREEEQRAQELAKAEELLRLLMKQ